MRQMFFMVVFMLSAGTLNAQNYPIKTIKLGAYIGSTVAHTSGLELTVSLTNTRLNTERLAVLEGAPERCRITRMFTLFITIINKGQDSILITDWHFNATCPEDNLGRQWDEHSFIKLITPIIPSNINLLLKPNEKKSFSTVETDFTWCLPYHDTALTTRPCTVNALITCAQLGNSVYNKAVGFFPNSCPQIKYGNGLPPCPPIKSTPSTPSTPLSGSKTANPKPLLATYRNDKDQWVAIGPYMTTDGFDTEEQAINSLFYAKADLTPLTESGKYRIYILNVKVEHDARDVRKILTSLGVENIPDK